jgi:hypothetical protein
VGGLAAICLYSSSRGQAGVDEILFLARDRDSSVSRKGDGSMLLKKVCGFFEARRQAGFADELRLVAVDDPRVVNVYQKAHFVHTDHFEKGDHGTGTLPMVRNKRVAASGCVSPFADVRRRNLQVSGDQLSAKLAEELRAAEESITLGCGRGTTLRLKVLPSHEAREFFARSRLRNATFMSKLDGSIDCGARFISISDGDAPCYACLAYSAYAASSGSANPNSPGLNHESGESTVLAVLALAVDESVESNGKRRVAFPSDPACLASHSTLHFHVHVHVE